MQRYRLFSFSAIQIVFVLGRQLIVECSSGAKRERSDTSRVATPPPTNGSLNFGKGIGGEEDGEDVGRGGAGEGDG
jgi:hypothetical protein